MIKRIISHPLCLLLHYCFHFRFDIRLYKASPQKWDTGVTVSRRTVPGFIWWTCSARGRYLWTITIYLALSQRRGQLSQRPILGWSFSWLPVTSGPAVSAYSAFAEARLPFLITQLVSSIWLYRNTSTTVRRLPPTVYTIQFVVFRYMVLYESCLPPSKNLGAFALLLSSSGDNLSLQDK